MPELSPVDIMWRSDDGTEIPLKIDDRFANQPPYAADFYQEIAMIILHWSHVEWGLDHILDEVSHIKSVNRHEGAPLISFKRRVRAIKDAIKGVEIFGDTEPSDFTTQVLSQAKISAKDRNIISHYNFVEFKDGNEPKIIFVDFERGLKDFTVKDLQLVRANIKLLEAQLVMLRFFIHAKVWSESGKFLPPVREKTDRSPDSGQ